ncbi:hypothetical protein K7432_006793 [Basidiobolus ranarum]|uniref:Uncharacterized protein n=1 Tax=Basidiobolus ranarum TaxID=34480 RepID=A0ABR2WUB3_9FUNG
MSWIARDCEAFGNYNASQTVATKHFIRLSCPEEGHKLKENGELNFILKSKVHLWKLVPDMITDVQIL